MQFERNRTQRQKTVFKHCLLQDILDGKDEKEMQSQIPELALDKGEILVQKFSKLKEALELLSSVARSIQTKREKAGALRLESSEVTFEFQRSNLEDIKPKQHLVSTL